MTSKTEKSKRPAPGWPDGWHTIGGDVVDFEAMLDFDAVILGKRTMPLCCYDADAATLLGAGPYVARPAKDGDDGWPYWYIAGPDGRRNVLTFPGGAVLTDKETAMAIIAPKASTTPPESPPQPEAMEVPADRQAEPQEAHQAHSGAAAPPARRDQ